MHTEGALKPTESKMLRFPGSNQDVPNTSAARVKWAVPIFHITKPPNVALRQSFPENRKIPGIDQSMELHESKDSITK